MLEINFNPMNRDLFKTDKRQKSMSFENFSVTTYFCSLLEGFPVE